MATKLALTRRIAELYAQGENMLQNLRSLGSEEGAGAGPVETRNSVEDIMISYDFQAGSYIESYRRSPEYLERYTDEVAKILAALGPCATLLEAGCGEATTLAVLAAKLPQPAALAGFDVSWSRARLGRDFAAERGQRPTLFCADLFRIPLADRSVDIVYTSHSVEPNGGREREAVAELARVARRWLVLLEPAHELASEEGRRRMERHGYVRGLPAAIRNLGLELIEHRLLPVCANPLNPTGLYLVRIDAAARPADAFRFRCPVSGSPLLAGEHAYFAPESFLAYPVLDGIPCLLETNAILATRYQAPIPKGGNG